MKRDKEAFLKVLEANSGIIFKICNMYCRDPEDQKDLAQDIIIQLWKSFYKYDERYKISTWMYRIAINVAISSYRKASVRRKHTTTIDYDFVHIAGEDHQDYQEEILLLRHFINQLDALNKALMILYLDGNSYEEIGGILNISATNVGTKINRIKQKISNQFKTYNSHGN